jgi:simple sugar transport system ATP-binding protein
METPLIEIRNVHKSFGNREALANVTVDFCQGEVHAILGENGAGKSTLMNILYGLYQQDAGEIFLDGAQLELNVPQDAITAGIGMIHQHFMLVPSFTVAENIVLGDSRYRGMSFDRRRAEREVAMLSRKLGLTIDPRARVEDLAVGQQQRVEIIKALFRGAKLLILDEPTAVLTPQETEDLFATLRLLRDEERSIIFISHKLAEVRAISDRVTILRRGAAIGTFLTEEISETDLARHMVGEDIIELPPRDTTTPNGRAKPILHVENLWLRRPDGGEALRGLSFDLCPGEILGIAGVDGNGQRELAEELIGVRPPRYKGFLERGRVWLGDQEITVLETRFRYELGMAEIPSDRRSMGIFPTLSINENLMAYFHRDKPFRRLQFLNFTAIRKRCKALINMFDIRADAQEQHAETLSGGNQQKLVVARELSRRPRVLIAVNPTRGVDIQSAARIRAELLEQKSLGAAILLISTDLDEIIEISDRVAVMVAGQFSGVLMAGAAREQYGRLMLGATTTHFTSTTHAKQSA